MMTITKTGLISAAAALMLFAGLAGRMPAQVMVQTKPGDTPLSPSGNLPSATPQFGVKEARENLIRQIEKISAESEVYQHIADGLRQSFAGTHAEAIKGNLIGLKLAEARAALLAPTVAALEDYRTSIKIGVRRNLSLGRRYSADTQRTRQEIERTAEEIVRMRKALDSLSKDPEDSVKVRTLTEQIEEKANDIAMLLKWQDDLQKYTTKLDEAMQADKAELEELQSLDSHLDQFARREKHYVDMTLIAIESDSNHMVVVERQGLRDAIRNALDVIREDKGRSGVMTSLGTDPPKQPIGSGRRKLGPRVPAASTDPRVLKVIREAESKINPAKDKAN